MILKGERENFWGNPRNWTEFGRWRMLQSERAALASTQRDSGPSRRCSVPQQLHAHGLHGIPNSPHSSNGYVSTTCLYNVPSSIISTSQKCIPFRFTSDLFLHDFWLIQNEPSISTFLSAGLCFILHWTLVSGTKALSFLQESIFTKNDSTLYLWQSLIRATYSRMLPNEWIWYKVINNTCNKLHSCHYTPKC